MSFFNKCIKSHFASARPKGKQTHNGPGRPQVSYPPRPVAIRLHSDGSIVSGLFVEETIPGDRDVTPFKRLSDKTGAVGNLLASGGVLFSTVAGKSWFIKFTEFSFVFNHKRPSKKPTPPVPTVAVELKLAA